MNQVTFQVHLDPDDVKSIKGDPCSPFLILTLRVQKVEKVVLS